MYASSHTETHIFICLGFFFAPAFAFLSHLCLYYPFHIDNSFHYIQKWAKVVTKEEKAWLTFIQYPSRTWDSWTLITIRRVYAFIPSEEKCMYTGRYWTWKALGNCRDRTAVGVGGNDSKARALRTESLCLPILCTLCSRVPPWEIISISRLNISPDIKYCICFDIGH